VPYAGLTQFTREFRYSSSMVVAFPQGSEAPWTASLTGTNFMSDRFVECIGVVRRGQTPGQATQPYSGPTQPFGGGPTQPFSGTQPPVVAPPVAPPAAPSSPAPSFGGSPSKPQPDSAPPPPPPSPGGKRPDTTI
jgi:hypothetical protein